MSRFRWLWYAPGIAMIAWGVRGLMTNTSTTALLHTLRLVVLNVGGHDVLFAPLAFALALLTGRLPAVIRTPVRVGLAIGVVLTMLALPVILSDHRLRSPSVLPLPYERNLGILLGLVATAVVVSVVVRALRARALSRTPAPPPRG